ncbi:hypothetical protein ACF09G_25140 [Streptomyces albogriseolus]|uniref:Uncharacterized protein n=2 Tax=Streptomyces albogriseolus group TaxID=2867120 RepID=A0ABP6UC00_9ACTN|nr:MULTISPECIES: hypothetical protein [Streptomyces]MCX4570978.1 hypothetical protein [Streptomyces viridodiastaticus]WPP33607.1 hypothetical protein SJH97_31665 [Streptomyces sp. CL7]GHB83667.1 hypothetical protein GCM10010332_03660 [Streptomyces albogriseolus]GHG20901.1 hypothetical protein GCM10018777_39210 [Streptomyces viridodiastaticus]
MSEHDDTPKQSESALEEVLREVEDAERRTRDTDEDRRHRGEAGEAITPNTEAQEESSGE